MAQPVVLSSTTPFSLRARDTSMLLSPHSAAAAAPYGAIGTPAIRYEVEGTRIERREPAMTDKSSPYGLPYNETSRESRWHVVAPYIAEFIGTLLLVFTVATCAYTSSLHNDGSLKFNGNSKETFNIKAPFAHIYNNLAISSGAESTTVSSSPTANVSAGAQKDSSVAPIMLAQQAPGADDANGDGDGDGDGVVDGDGDGDGAADASAAAGAPEDTSPSDTTAPKAKAASVSAAPTANTTGQNGTDGASVPVPAGDGGNSQMNWAPTAVGCALTVLIYAVAFVSGGHLNPAVSLASFLARKIDAFKFLCYVTVQLFGGFLGGFLFDFVFLTHASSVMPKAPYHFGAAALIEILFTAMLCFVALNVASSARNNPENDRNQFFAMAIGFVLVAAGYAGANISGAVLNPSVALGLDLAGWWQTENVKYGCLYALVELLGGLLGFILFRFCRLGDYMESSRDGEFADEFSYQPVLFVRMFSELVGTFFLVVTFGLNVMLQSGAAAWSTSAALMSLVYALGNVSGGHFNPAVTAAVVLSGRNKCSSRDGGYYVLMQVLAAVMASWVLGYVHRNGPTADIHFMLLGMTGPSTWGAVAAMETIFTFLLCWVVLAVSTVDEYRVGSSRSRPNYYFALAIGFAMFVGSCASSTVSGGYLNPSIGLGIAFEGLPPFDSVASVKDWPRWTDPILQALAVLCKTLAYFAAWLLYLVFELIGAILAAGVFHVTHPAEYQKGMSPLMPLWSDVKEEGS